MRKLEAEEKEIRLTEEQRRFLFVRAKACPSNATVIADIKAKYGIEISAPLVTKYRKEKNFHLGMQDAREVALG